mgnify:CR=1 FL=1
MKLLDALYSLLEQLPSEFVFLKVGEYVDLLQVKQIRILLLDGHIARRLTFLVSDVVNVMLFSIWFFRLSLEYIQSIM